MFKVFQSGEFLCSLRNNLGTLGKDMANRTIPDPAIPLAKDVLQELVSKVKIWPTELHQTLLFL